MKNADNTFSDLINNGIIDCIGTFLPGVTESTVQKYCISQNIDVLFFKTVFIMQMTIGQLSGKELPFWNHKLGELRLKLSIQQLIGGNSVVCDELLVYIYQMQSHYGGDEVLDFILELLTCQSQRDVPNNRLVDLFSKCSSKEWSFSVVIALVKRNSNGSSLLQVLNDLQSFNWESYRNEERTAKELIEFLKLHHPLHEDSEHLFSVLDTIENNVADIKEKEKCKSQFYTEENKRLTSTPINEYSKDHIHQWVVQFKNLKKSLKGSYFIEAFAVIRRAITLFYEIEKGVKGVSPRDTQMVSCLLFFHDLSAQGGAQGTKLLQQISTGEGKTMILCMAAIYKVLLGERVDIVTSSSVLATRDAVDQKALYDIFNITVTHCCHEELSSRRKAYEADVIYGDIGSFQRDTLETDFYDHNIRTDRRFDNVFVDEVDSMLVDKGQNMLYLPHVLPDMNCLHQVYLEIWSLVNAKGFIGLPQEQEYLYFILKHRVFGAISPNTFIAISEISA